MVHYLGSKQNHAGDILEHVLAKRRKGQVYVEPFIGGGNVFCRVPQSGGPRIGADINKFMIALHTALANGWEPPDAISEKDYRGMKRNPSKYPPELVGFAGTGCAFGSMWFNTYTGEKVPQAKAACLRDAPGLRGGKFICSSVFDLEIPPRSIIYCDPPYKETEGYAGGDMVGESAGSDKWRAYIFWRWADKMVDAGHSVFVSEYTDPVAGDIYNTVQLPPDMVRKKSELQAKYRAAQVDVNATQADRDQLIADIADIDEYVKKERRRLVARWEVVWTKKVTVMAAGGANALSNETKYEKLFHRSR